MGLRKNLILQRRPWTWRPSDGRSPTSRVWWTGSQSGRTGAAKAVLQALPEPRCRKFRHDQKDCKRRCFERASTQHMAGAFPHAKEGGAKVREAQPDDGLSASPSTSAGTPTSAATGRPVGDDSQVVITKKLLGEPNKMLRGLGGGQGGGALPGGAEDEGEGEAHRDALQTAAEGVGYFCEGTARCQGSTVGPRASGLGSYACRIT